MFNKKKVVVIGAGVSGKSAVSLLCQLGAKVYIYDDDKQRAQQLADESGVIFLDSGDYPSVISSADYCVLSPGVSINSNLAVMAQALGVRVIPEIELAYLVYNHPIIAVTGTNGKSSMVQLLGNLCAKNGLNAQVCGNVGYPFSEVARNGDGDLAVVETSSFQLESISEFRASINVVLNVKPDHIDRHGDFNGYFLAKRNIVKNATQDDVVIVNYDDKYARQIGENCSGDVYYFSCKTLVKQGVYLDGDDIIAVISGRRYQVGKTSDIKDIKTPIENALALIASGLVMNVSFGLVYSTLREFVPMPHTMQKLEVPGKVKYIDDSKGTNISATLCAINNIDGEIALICGGRTKGENYAELFGVLPERIVSAVCLGENAEEFSKLAYSLGIKSMVAKDVYDAVEIASKAVEEKGGTVLFSPATASFDNYKNYAERGDAFINAVFTYAQV